ncbi:hypothetical protein COLO4_05336 [Corchorus olitorius]|uniref:Uncharacterized protein n=1 Tax=Corchorus olitorius TaxID=93759 RepID=A0A1R3KRA0_9ROSI|nr:hypothetical protein COLO4_05336 [Corchorus olitorius]
MEIPPLEWPQTLRFYSAIYPLSVVGERNWLRWQYELALGVRLKESPLRYPLLY